MVKATHALTACWRGLSYPRIESIADKGSFKSASTLYVPNHLEGAMCKYVNSCTFFQEFSSRESFIWKAMIKNYCDDGGECVRRKTYEAEGINALPAKVMPSGAHASKAFLALP